MPTPAGLTVWTARPCAGAESFKGPRALAVVHTRDRPVGPQAIFDGVRWFGPSFAHSFAPPEYGDRRPPCPVVPGAERQD